MTLRFKHPLQPGYLEAESVLEAFRAMELGWRPVRPDGSYSNVQRPDGGFVVDGLTLNEIYKNIGAGVVMTDRERIQRLEAVLCAIYQMLPKFIKQGLGPDVEKVIQRMSEDLKNDKN